MRRAVYPPLYVAALTAFLMATVFASPAFAYLDPGTYQTLWTGLAPLVGVLVGCIALVLVPFWFLIGRVRALWARRPKGKRALAWLGAVVIFAVAVGGAGVFFLGKKHEVGNSAAAMKAGGYERVLVLGMDGLDPGILDRMMDAGELPNFAKLRKEGSYARLQTSVPPESPVAWTCAATGMNPGRHGIYDYVEPQRGTYLPISSNPRLRSGALATISGQPYAPALSVKTFWDIASDHGKTVSVIRWPVTFPAQRVNGHLLTGLGTPAFSGRMQDAEIFMTRPLMSGEPPEDKVVVKWERGVISTELRGPEIVTLTGRKVGTVPCRIEKNDADSVTIRLGTSEPFSLKVGEWSGWRPIEFPGGVASSCPVIAKLCLYQIDPEFELYVTSLQIDPMKPAYPISYPGEYAKDLAQEIGYYATLGLAEEPESVTEGWIPLPAYLKLCNDITREREAMFERELKQFKSGLLAIVFDTSDRIEHVFWAATDPQRATYTPEMARAFGHVIEDHYKRMDAVLGRAIHAAHGDMAILVMSDHGFANFHYGVHLNTWLIQKGYMHVKNLYIPGGQVHDNVDWSKTKAFAVGYCGVYLNVRGREHEGIVQSPDEYRRVRDEIAQALRDWRDPTTGAQVVRSVYTRDEVYQGTYLDEAPDLVVGYTPGYRASGQTMLGAAPLVGDIVLDKSPWSGDHMMDAASVPGIFLSTVKCNVSNPRLIDIAPTVLRLLNLPASSDMDGRPLW